VQSITLQNLADTAIVNNDILGQIAFAAPNEAGGTDSILIAASIFARSEGTFASDNNATELVFTTAFSESAAPGATNYDMTLSSAGNLTVAGTITCVTSLTIGSASMSEADLEFLDGITAGTAVASKAVVLDGSKNIATIGTIGCGAITSTGSSSFGATSFGDNNITNVGSLACDSVVVDAAAVGLDIVFGGNTTLNKLTLTDNIADALNITEGSNSYMKFVTTDNATRIIHNVGVVGNPTALTSQSGSVVINAALGNYFTVATTGAITGLDIQNAVVGQKILIRFAWGGTHSIAYTDTVIWPGGTAASVTASGVDVIGFICTTASSAFDAFIVGEDVKAV
jgi:hypothetical protein